MLGNYQVATQLVVSRVELSPIESVSQSVSSPDETWGNFIGGGTD
jgi:hypothetical protein